MEREQRSCQCHLQKLKGLLEKINLGADSHSVCNFVTRAPRKGIILENASTSEKDKLNCLIKKNTTVNIGFNFFGKDEKQLGRRERRGGSELLSCGHESSLLTIGG